MAVEDGEIEAIDEVRGKFVVHFASDAYALFEVIRQPGQEASEMRLSVGDTVRTAPETLGKTVMLNMSRKLPVLVNGLTGPADRSECLRRMGP